MIQAAHLLRFNMLYFFPIFLRAVEQNNHVEKSSNHWNFFALLHPTFHRMCINHRRMNIAVAHHFFVPITTMRMIYTAGMTSRSGRSLASDG